MAGPESPLLGQLNASLRILAAPCLAALAGCAAVPAVERPPAAELRAAGDAQTLERVRALGRDGDWLVIRGYHLSDNFVATVTNNPFSHAAVLDLERDRVVEAEAKGIHFTPLAEFVAKSHRLLLIRPVWSDAASAPAALARARSLVGRPYNFAGLLGVDVPESFYCSELTLEVYRPYLRPGDVVPRPIEPGKLHYWGRVLYDSGAR